MSIQKTDFFHAAARIVYLVAATASFLAQKGFSLITPNGVGDFTVTVTDAIDATACTVHFEPMGTADVGHSVEQLTDTTFRVRTFNTAGAAVDAPGSLTILRFD